MLENANHQHEEENELTILPPLFWVAVIFLAFAPLYGCATTKAAARAPQSYDGPPLVMQTQDGDMVKLTKEPCPQVTGWLSLSKAYMVYQGRSYEACWTLMGQYVLVFDSNQDLSPIPVAAFRKDEGV